MLVQRHLLTTPDASTRSSAPPAVRPEVADLLIRYAMGEVSYSEARRRLLLRAPLLALRLFMATQTSA